MSEYIYKGFKISYKIYPVDNINTYMAEGTLCYLLNVSQPFEPKKFFTEYDSYNGAEYEIKKKLENYIDLELKNYFDMKKEKAEQAS